MQQPPFNPQQPSQPGYPPPQGWYNQPPQGWNNQPLQGYPQPQQRFQPPPMQPLPTQKPKKKRRTGCIIGIVLAVICACVAASALASNLPSSSSTQQAQVTSTSATHPTTSTTKVSTQKSAQATQPSQAKATVITGNTVTHGIPRIGGPISDYIGKYGQPDKSNSQKDYYVFDSSDGSIFLTATTSNGYVLADLINAPNHQTWSESQATSECLAFAPADSVYKRQMTFSDQQGNLMNLQKVYYSTSLGTQVPANEFTDENNKLTAPGTFGVVLSYDLSGTSSFITCAAQIGLQQY